MQSLSTALRAISGIVGICALLGAAGESASGEPRRSGWYVGAGVGANWPSSMEQVGQNRDTVCYPNDDCSDRPGGVPDGYRWSYDLESGSGAAFEASIGRMFGPVRLELSATQRKHDLDQQFSGITYLDGARVRVAGNDIQSNSMTSVEGLTTSTLSPNVYYDFPTVADRITPYLGGGVGLAFLKMSNLHFSSNYTGTRRPSDPPLQSFNSRQDVDLSDTALAKHLYAGADYGLSNKTLLGVKLGYTQVGDIEDVGGYTVHPVPGLTSLTRISGMDHWSLTITLKYRFGG